MFFAMVAREGVTDKDVYAVPPEIQNLEDAFDYMVKTLNKFNYSSFSLFDAKFNSSWSSTLVSEKVAKKDRFEVFKKLKEEFEPEKK